MRRIPWARVTLVVVILLIAVFAALSNLPISRRLPSGLRKKFPPVNLGLDIRGGMHLVLELDMEEAISSEVERYVEDLKVSFRAGGVQLKRASAEGRRGEVEIELRDAGQQKEAEKIIREEERQQDVWNITWVGDRALHLDMKGGERKEIQDAVLRRAVEIVRRRVDEHGVREAPVQRQGERRVVVQLPGIKDPERARELLKRTGRLEFHLAKFPTEVKVLVEEADRKLEGELSGLYLVETDPNAVLVRRKDRETVEKLLNQPEARAVVPTGWTFAFGKPPKAGDVGVRRNLEELHLIKKQVEISGGELKHAYPGYGGMRPIVHLEWKRAGAISFEKITGEHTGERLAAVVDGVVESAPLIKSRISRHVTGIIEGDFTMQEAADLAVMLRAGALPVSMKIVQEWAVGPSLGEDAIRKGVRAAVVGAVLVAVFMAIYYLKAGLIADFALAFNMLVILAVLSGFRATLTLPGIAGIILVVGMAVDANVLIFERIREEMAAGKAVRTAIATGYHRAFLTILDANATTFIAAFVLYHLGGGPVRGFATTLMIGLASSMFTGVFFTRLIFDLLLQRSGFKRVRMLRFLGRTSFDFISRRRFAYLFSLALISLGMIAVAGRGQANLGHEFKGGLYMIRVFKRAIPLQEIRDCLQQTGLGNVLLQQYREEERMGLIIRSELEKSETGSQEDEGEGSGLAGRIDKVFRTNFEDELLDPAEFGETSFVGATVGKELRHKALIAIIVALGAIVAYMSWRFEYRFGLAAIVALAQDVLVTVGILALAGREITLPIVGALLAIVGYSLNDTIVVFDRIREDLRLLRRQSYAAIVSTSINKTLARTMLTSLTTLVAVGSLLVLGTGAMKDFAFTLMVGVAVGTYSSIFVASPLLVGWRRHSRKQGEKHLGA